MSENAETAKKLLCFGITRDIKYLFKYLLTILDDFERDGLINANNKAFYRSKILDQGNAAIRSLEDQLKNFNIDFDMTLINKK